MPVCYVGFAEGLAAAQPIILLPLPVVAVVADDYKGNVGDEASVNGKGYWRHIEAHKL